MHINASILIEWGKIRLVTIPNHFESKVRSIILFLTKKDSQIYYNMSKKDLYQKIKEIDSSHINEEYVFPCITKDQHVYLHPSIQDNIELEALIKKNLVTIVTKPWVASVTKVAKQQQLQVLHSLRENGRVLEANDTIQLDGVTYKMMIKWVWATNYYRTTWAKNPWMRRHEHTHDDREVWLLEQFPFLDWGGILPLTSAIIEKEKVQEMIDLWIDTEEVLAIYEIDQIYGPDGKYHDIKTLQDDGVIFPDWQPCLLIRAQKSNIRLMDIILLEKTQKKYLIEPMMHEILKEAKEYLGVENLQEYLEVLIKKLIKQRLSLHEYGTRNGERRQDIIRNITVLWEEVDLVTMKHNKSDWYKKNPYDFVGRFERIMNEIMPGLHYFIEILQNQFWDSLDLTKLAYLIVEQIEIFIQNNMSYFTETYKQWWYYKRYYVTDPSQWISKFQNHLIKKIFSFNVDYVVMQDLGKEIRKVLIEKKIYQERG